MNDHSLIIRMKGSLLGTVEQDAAGLIHLHYDSSWLARPDALPLSLSLPLSQSHHVGDIVRNYLQGLLPDNPNVRQRWARHYHVSPDNPFRLLQPLACQ